MNKSEWVKIGARLMRLWPHQTIPDDALPEWYLLLADLDGETVNAAVTALATAGREFPPPAGVIRAKALELQQCGTTFEDCWEAINRAIAKYGSYRAEEAMAALESVEFGIDLVNAMGGWQAICLGGPDEYKPIDPGVWRSQAEHAWKALSTRRRDDRALAGMKSDLPRIAAARRRLVGTGSDTLERISSIGLPGGVKEELS